MMLKNNRSTHIMSLEIYLLPIFILGSIYIVRLTKDLVKEKIKISKYSK